MSRTSVHSRLITDQYLELVKEFPLRPIRSKSEYRDAGKIIDRLAVRDEGTLSPGEQDYLETLSLLIEDYDRKHLPPETPADPIETLKFIMEESGMTVSALGKVLGSKSVASEVLRGKRSLSKANISKLAEYFRLDVSVFFPNPN
jgi:HTH-type transcriptional regulator / antitoxin HigA